MDRSKAEVLIVSIARFNGADPDLAMAIAEKESRFDEWAVRFEPGWKYLFEIEKFAKADQISRDTEKMLQACSFGLMQIMGTVARERGFRGCLLELTKPEIGVKYACLQLKHIAERYKFVEDQISAYNCGTPSLDVKTGRYSNHEYVLEVKGYYAKRKLVR